VSWAIKNNAVNAAVAIMAQNVPSFILASPYFIPSKPDPKKVQTEVRRR
jgi:hypothetical protein